MHSAIPKIWFTSDPHFGHANVIKYSNRPFTGVEGMNSFMIDQWNERVGVYDVVYCLGDMFLCGFKKAEPVAKQLRGHKILIQGNHDKFSKTQYGRLGFAEVTTEALVSIGGDMVKLSHFPYKPPEHLMTEYDKRGLRYLDRRPVPAGERYLLHGHVHEHWKHRIEDERLMINVGVDVWDFKPVAKEQIETLARDLT